MFLRKLMVMVLPLALVFALCLVLPLLGGLGFFANVLRGLLLGVGLALLLPLSGAGRKKEPFAGLLWVPTALLVFTVLYQYLSAIGVMNLPVLAVLTTTSGQVVLVECAFIGYMLTQSIRTKT